MPLPCNRLTLAMLIASIQGSDRIKPPVNAVPEAAPPRRAPGRRKGYMPHQNVREAARRIGGQVWLDYRNADRKHRGLPPLDR